MGHLLFQNILITAFHVFDVDNVLVLFIVVIVVIIVVVSISRFATHHITTWICIVIRSLAGSSPFARDRHALSGGLAADLHPLLLLQLLEVLPGDVLGASCGRWPLLAPGIAVRIGLKLRDCELSW